MYKQTKPDFIGKGTERHLGGFSMLIIGVRQASHYGVHTWPSENSDHKLILYIFSVCPRLLCKQMQANNIKLFFFLPRIIADLFLQTLLLLKLSPTDAGCCWP